MSGTLRAGLRDLLGHPVTSTDAELLDAAREVKGERDRADAEIAKLAEGIAALRVALPMPDRALDGEVLAEAVRRVKATPPTAATAPQPATLDALLAACEDDGASPHVIRALRLLLGLTATDQRSAS